jgi:hypothetical protein
MHDAVDEDRRATQIVDAHNESPSATCSCLCLPDNILNLVSQGLERRRIQRGEPLPCGKAIQYVVPISA